MKVRGCSGELRYTSRAWLISGLLICFTTLAAGQTWKWTTEDVDHSGSNSAIFMIADADGNVHASYANDLQGVMYAFRPAGVARWFTLPVEKIGYVGFTRLAVDLNGNPHLCYTAAGRMKYAALIDNKWRIQEINPGSGTIAYSCSVAVSRDGTPQVTWYQERDASDLNYLHFKYARLKGGNWLAKTIDFDAQTGKWHQMVLDSQGRPRIAYDAFVKGELRYASCSDGDNWVITRVDSRDLGRGENWNVGMGNSLVLDKRGAAHMTYYHSDGIYYAYQTKQAWHVERIDGVAPLGSWVGYRSSLALSSHEVPYVSYEDAGVLKLAYSANGKWNRQVLVDAISGSPFLFSTMTMDAQDTLYIGYRDPADGSLKVAVGRPQTAPRAVGMKTPSR